jgi:hypothetical protein
LEDSSSSESSDSSFELDGLFKNLDSDKVDELYDLLGKNSSSDEDSFSSISSDDINTFE